jgi:hypothetical protein
MTLKGLIHIDIAKIPGQTDYIEKATSCATVAVSVLASKKQKYHLSDNISAFSRKILFFI